MASKKSGAVRDLIKKTRADLSMSQTKFAEYIGTTPAVLQRWESATTSPSGLMTARLIEVGVSVRDLIDAFEADAAAKLKER